MIELDVPEKVEFSVSDVKLIDENPKSSFAVMSIDFFASGKNLHDMYVSEETLMRTADSIKNCPLVWKYDSILEDIGTHDKDEVACGFVPEKAEITSRVLADGRTMLSVMAYVWKRYTGEILNFFKRDGGEKPVSVEISVFSMKDIPNGLKELLDYKFEAITILGSYVTPAIPLAKANVLSFAQEYESLVKKEFSRYASVDFKIPEKVKKNSAKALKEYSVNGWGNSVLLSIARHLVNNDTVSPDKVRYIQKHVSGSKTFTKGSKEERSLMFLGGKDSIEWAADLCGKLDMIDSETLRYFESEEIDSDKPDEPKEAVLLKNEKEETTNMADENVKPVEEEFEAETAKSEKEETPSEEKTESPEKEKQEKAEGIEKKFAFPKNIDTEKMSAIFADDEDEDVKMAKAELEKGVFAQPEVVMSGMFKKMCKMAADVAQMAEDSKAYMSENEELKKFKADVEEKQKMFAVESMLNELSTKVVISPEAREEMISESEKYSFAELDGWKTFCKAMSFDFAIKNAEVPSMVKVAAPFQATAKPKGTGLWDN